MGIHCERINQLGFRENCFERIGGFNISHLFGQGAFQCLALNQFGIALPTKHTEVAVPAFARVANEIFGMGHMKRKRYHKRKQAKNSFDRLFFVGMVMSLMVFAIALPVAAIDHTTVPLSIGILAGLMWMPLSWAIEHWIGYFHTLTRTFGIVAAWYLFPDARVEAISAVIVAVYIVSLITLERRFQSIKSN